MPFSPVQREVSHLLMDFWLAAAESTPRAQRILERLRSIADVLPHDGSSDHAGIVVGALLERFPDSAAGITKLSPIFCPLTLAAPARDLESIMSRPENYFESPMRVVTPDDLIPEFLPFHSVVADHLQDRLAGTTTERLGTVRQVLDTYINSAWFADLQFLFATHFKKGGYQYPILACLETTARRMAEYAVLGLMADFNSTTRALLNTYWGLASRGNLLLGLDLENRPLVLCDKPVVSTS